MIRLATFNTQHGARAEGYLGNPEQTAAACASLRADVLALQEVDKGTLRCRRADLAALVAEASDMKVVFAPSIRFRIGSYGNALLVRGEIENYEVLEMTGGHRIRLRWRGHQLLAGHEGHNAILATVRVGERRISLAATHLSTEPPVNARHLPQVISALAARPEPRVLMGDLNRRRHQILELLATNGLVLADGPPTFPAPSPTAAIDQIAVTGLTVRAVEAVALPVSDHLALVADVE
jgi:endonuclease/exonuclease/phosphatase family metal-dependent hydrolase